MPEQNLPPGFIPSQSHLAGIEVFVPTPADVKPQAEVVEFNCPQCGATTAYSAAGGGLTCAHCGYYEAPAHAVVGAQAETYEFTVETVERSAQGWGLERKEVECQNCGARTAVDPELLSLACPFCGSNKVIQRAAPADVLRPRFLVPFRVDTKACHELAHKWMGSSWMTPENLQKVASLVNFTPIYLPFWTFSSVSTADWKAEVGHTQTERYYEDGKWKTRTKIAWRWESGHVRVDHKDLLVVGTSRLSRLLLDRLKKYDLSGLTPYDPQYLAGMQAQAYDVTLEKAWEDGRQQMREKTRTTCEGQASTSMIRNFSMNLDFSDESWRYVLMPVYLSAYPYEGKLFQAMINGQTGAVAGQRPVDWHKIWLVLAAILAPGVFLSLLGLITLPLAGLGILIGGVGVVLLIIGLVVDFILYGQAQAMDDV